jgi:PHD/YefM family antitoxin component YafN of YafNO toxin-antitoxin module
MTYNFMPKTFSVRDVQRNYRAIVTEAKTNSPIVILNNNLPDVAIVNLDYLENLINKATKNELKDALNSVSIYNKEKKAGKLKELNSLKELM